MVLVVWEDAGSTDDAVWVTNKGKREYEPIIHRQLGFLLADDPAGIIISSTYNESLLACPDQIPRGMIRSISYLTVGGKKRSR